MATRELTLTDGQTVLVDIGEHILTFVDKRGKTIDFFTHFIVDSEFYRQVGYRTQGGLLKWVVENRDQFPNEWRHFLIPELRKIFGDITPHELSTSSLDTLRSFNSGHLRDPIPNVCLYQNPGSSPRFVLVKPESSIETRTPVHGYYSQHMGRIRVQPIESTEEEPVTFSHSEKWYRKWNYTYKMDPDEFNFFRTVRKESGPFFGMEVEVNSRLSQKELQYIVTEVEPKQEPFFIFKDDASISRRMDHRYEIVTVPCSPRYLRSEWSKLFKKIEALLPEGDGLEDYFDFVDNNCNGIHIHVSNEAFSSESHIRRFMTSCHQHNKSSVALFQQMSGRDVDYHTHSYCHASEEYKQRFLSYRLNPKSRINVNRTSVCHRESGQTVELRLFQSIFTREHIFRCISFTQALLEFTEGMSYRDFDKQFTPRFKAYVKEQKRFAILKECLDKCA